MRQTPEQPLLRAIEALLAGLEKAGADYMIIGGLAVIARGVVRHTDDADATIRARIAEFAEAIEEPERLSELDEVIARIDDERRY